MIRLASVLIVVVLILYLSYLFTKSLGKGMVMKRKGSYMELLDRLPFGQDKAVALIRTGSHYYLIGIASSQITLLKELSEEEVGKEEVLPLPQSGAGYESFKTLLKKYTDKHKKDT
jgi:flagellar protein FliO/FliZ